MGLTGFRARCEMRIEALNHALRNIPEECVRYHLCWGSWHGPHAYDLELDRIVDIVLMVKAQAYLIEGANARHEHEVAVWEKVKLPAGKILFPVSSPIRPMLWSIPSSYRSVCSATRVSSVRRILSLAPTAASAAARIRRSHGRSCAPWSREQLSLARCWDIGGTLVGNTTWDGRKICTERLRSGNPRGDCG